MPAGFPGRQMPNGLMPTLTHGFRLFVSSYIRSMNVLTADRRQSSGSARARFLICGPGVIVGEWDDFARRVFFLVRIEIIVDVNALDVVAANHVEDHFQRYPERPCAWG